jgi:hypothetical protein
MQSCKVNVRVMAILIIFNSANKRVLANANYINEQYENLTKIQIKRLAENIRE